MIAVLVLIGHAQFNAIRIGLMKILYVWTSMRWTGLLEYAMLLLLLGWVVIDGWIIGLGRRKVSRRRFEELTSWLLISVVGAVEKVVLTLLLFHMQLQLLFWQSRLIYELRWFHVNMVAGCMDSFAVWCSTVGVYFMLIEFPVCK